MKHSSPSGKCLGTTSGLFSTENKLLTVTAVNHPCSFNRKSAFVRGANYTMYHVRYLCVFLAFNNRQQHAQRTLKGEIAGHSQPVTCSFCCDVICMCYTSFAPQQARFRARTLRATTAAPPHAVLRESLLCVNLAAAMGVCSDVNAISLSRTIVFSSAVDAHCSVLRTAS